MAQYTLQRDGFAGGDRAELNRMFAELYGNKADGDHSHDHFSRTDNPHGVTASQAGAIPVEQKGAASGVAPLDAGSLVPAANLPPDAVRSVDGRTGTVSLSDRYAGLAHKARHASGGADALAPGDIGAATSGHGHSNATTSAAGFASAADKAKLDGVRPNDAYADLTISVNQTGIASGTWTPVYWNSENADPRNWHSNSTNLERITFDTAGFYALTFYERWATSNASGVRYLRGLLNGGGVLFEDSVSAAVDSVGRVTAARMFAASAGDYLQLEVNQTSGSTLDLHRVTSVGVARLF